MSTGSYDLKFKDGALEPGVQSSLDKLKIKTSEEQQLLLSASTAISLKRIADFLDWWQTAKLRGEL